MLNDFNYRTFKLNPFQNVRCRDPHTLALLSEKLLELAVLRVSTGALVVSLRCGVGVWDDIQEIIENEVGKVEADDSEYVQMKEKEAKLEEQIEEQHRQIEHLTEMLQSEREWSKLLQDENDRLRSTILESQAQQADLVGDMKFQGSYNALFKQFQEVLLKIPADSLNKNMKTRLPTLDDYHYVYEPNSPPLSPEIKKNKKPQKRYPKRIADDTEHKTQEIFDPSEIYKIHNLPKNKKIVKPVAVVKKRESMEKTLDSLFVEWNVNETVKWLKSVGFEQYRDLFIKEQITGAVLTELDDEDLEEINMTNPQHRKEILGHILELVGDGD